MSGSDLLELTKWLMERFISEASRDPLETDLRMRDLSKTVSAGVYEEAMEKLVTTLREKDELALQVENQRDLIESSEELSRELRAVRIDRDQWKSRSEDLRAQAQAADPGGIEQLVEDRKAASGKILRLQGDLELEENLRKHWHGLYERAVRERDEAAKDRDHFAERVQQLSGDLGEAQGERDVLKDDVRKLSELLAEVGSLVEHHAQFIPGMAVSEIRRLLKDSKE